MKILIVGSGKGSWQMRGEQLGAALGARVRTSIADADMRWADVIVLVKRAASRLAPLVHRIGTPIVWDALDFWLQPQQNGFSAEQAKRLLRHEIAQIRPALVIGATEAMAEACGGVYLPHHPWTGLRVTSARPAVHTVAYDGNAAFLGAWLDVLSELCSARGWNFVVNPPDLRVADILVAVRHGAFDGWMCREWKSGVKLVNAIAAGRPIITQPSAAMRELRPAGLTIDTAEELAQALDALAPYAIREAAVEHSRALAPLMSVDAIASVYRSYLAGALERVA